MELYKLTIKEARDLLEKGEITSVELTESFLARINQLEPKLNSFITVTSELALKQAKASDERRARGEALSK